MRAGAESGSARRSPRHSPGSPAATGPRLSTTSTRPARPSELARRLDLPRPGCRAALDEFAASERPAHPVAAILVESAWGARHLVGRMRALRAMLHAGVALVRSGEPAFRAVPDPFGSGPFGLERRGWRIPP